MNAAAFLPIGIACILSSCTVGNSLPPSASTPQTPIIQANTTVPSITQTGTIMLTEAQKQVLQDAYREELLAYDVYTKMVEKYSELSEVTNIIRSESEHQSAVGRLLDARWIARPTDYGIYADTYATLIKMIETSRNEAIEAGIMIETGDIRHLVEEYKKIEDTEVRRVFENIGGGSFNHLRAFLRIANTYQYTSRTTYSDFLSWAELSQSGSLQYKMTELLQKNNLPTSGTGGRGAANQNEDHRNGRNGGGGRGMNH